MIRSVNPCPVCGGVHWLPLTADHWGVWGRPHCYLGVDWATHAIVDRRRRSTAIQDICGDLCLHCGTVVS